MNTFMKILFKNLNISLFLLFTDDLLLLSNWPDVPSTLSLRTDDPGTYKIALTTSVYWGIELFLLFH